MNDSDKEKLMGQRIISGADVTWELYWTVYKETPNHASVLDKLKINILSDALEEIESLAGNPHAKSYQAKFMRAVEDLKVNNPEAIFGETTKLTREATQNKFEAEVAEDELDSYERDIENRVKPKLASPLQPLRDAAAKAKDKIATAFKVPTLRKTKKSPASVSKQNSPLQHFANEFAETENNREDISTFGFDIEGYRNSAYVQTEAAKLKHDPTIRAEKRDSVEEVLDDLRNEFMDKWQGAQSALGDKLPEKNQEKNYTSIMDYAKALNNILKACAEKTGAPEWMPDTKLMAPVQWMLAQEPNHAELKSLYAEIVVNMIVVSAVPGVDMNQLIALKNIFAEAIATQNYMAAYDVATILIDVTLKNTSEPTVIIYRDLLRQEQARLEVFQPPKATWTEAEIMAEVEKQMTEEKRNSQPFNINRKDDWDRYWDYYKEEMQGKGESNRDVRLAVHKAVCEKVGLDWNKYSEIIGIADKAFNQGFFEHFGADKYRQNYKIGFKKEFDKQFLFNAGKEKNHTAELELVLNSGQFVSDFSSVRFMEIMRVFCSNDEQARKVLQSVQTLAIYAQRIKDLPMTDSIAKARAIVELLREPQYLYALAKFEAFRKGFYEKLDVTTRQELSQKLEEAGFLQIGEDANNLLNVAFQLLPRYPVTLKELVENLEKANDLRAAEVRQVKDAFEVDVIQPLNRLVGEFQDKELDENLVFLKIKVDALDNLNESQLSTLLSDMNKLLKSYLRGGQAASDPKIKKNVEILTALIKQFNEKVPSTSTIPTDSDTESPSSSRRSTTPMTSENDEDSDDEYDADPVIIQAQGDFSQNIQLENMSRKALATQYQHMRESFAEGNFEKAKDLLTGIYAGMVEAKKPEALGGDELVDGLREIIELSHPTNFDVKMSNRIPEVYNDSGEVAYLAMSLAVAVGAVQQEGKLLLTSDKPTIEKYNKIHKLFENNPDPFTMNGPRDVVKVTRAYREIARHDISTIANAILQDPALADAFFKRRLGTRLPGRRNFRKEFAEHPELIEKLISSRDPAILASMRDMGLLQTSHLNGNTRSRLVKFNTVLNDIETLDSLSPKEKNQKAHSADFKEGLRIRAEIFIANIHGEESLLDKYLADEFFTSILLKDPHLIQKLSDGLSENALEKIEEAGLVYEAIRAYARSLLEIGDDEIAEKSRKTEAMLKSLITQNSVEEKELDKAINNRILMTPNHLRTEIEKARSISLRDPAKRSARNEAINEAWEKEYGKVNEEHVASKVRFAEGTKFEVKEKRHIPKKSTPERSEQEVEEGMERMAKAGLENLKNKKPQRSAMKGARDESILNNQEMLGRAAENLEKMKPEDTVEDLIAELQALKLDKATHHAHQHACMDILDKINNKDLAKLLKEKVAQHPSEKFPDLDQMKAFVKDINDNMKVQNGVGLDYKRYLTMLTDSKYDGKFMRLLKLEGADFPNNNKGFQRPLPTATAGKTAQAQTSDVKPHPSK